MYKVLTLNNISTLGLDRFSESHYCVSDEDDAPDAIILRSFKMHDMQIPASLKAVGRAGAGVNNIPLDKMTERGIPCLLYTSPSPRDQRGTRMPSSA